MATGLSNISLDVFAIIIDNVTELQSLFCLAQTCRSFRHLLVDSSRKIGERAFLRIGRSRYAFFDEALLFGRIQNIPLEDLPRRDIQTGEYLNIPTKEWFTAVSQKSALSQSLGPHSLTTSYYKTWVSDYLSMNCNLSLAFEWVPNKMAGPKYWNYIQRPLSPSLLRNELAEFNALLIGFFVYQIFTHLFGPHIFTSPIKQALSHAQEASEKGPGKWNGYNTFLKNLESNRVREHEEEMSHHRLWHQLILPPLKQHPLHHTFRHSSVESVLFNGFFDWFFEGETTSTAKLKCYLLWASSFETAEYDREYPYYIQQHLSTEPATNPSRVIYAGTTLLPCQSSSPSLWIDTTATNEDVMWYWRTRQPSTRTLTPLHPKIIFAKEANMCTFYEMLMLRCRDFGRRYGDKHGKESGTLKSWRGLTKEVIFA